MIKTADEIALMAESGRLLAQVFTRLDQLDLMHSFSDLLSLYR